MINICWLGQGGFLFEHNNCRLLVDPYLSDIVFKKQGLARLHPFPLPLEELRPDVLAITHDHLDHFDPEGIPLLREAWPECRCAGTERSYNHFLQLGTPAELVDELKPGQTFQAGSFTILPAPVFHSDPSSCGFLITADNKKIVLTGDSCFDERLLYPEWKNADLLLICINGKLNNMNSSEAAECVKHLTPKKALPMHIGLFAENTADPDEFVSSCRKLGVDSFAMTPGEFFEI